MAVNCVRLKNAAVGATMRVLAGVKPQGCASRAFHGGSSRSLARAGIGSPVVVLDLAY